MKKYYKKPEIRTSIVESESGIMAASYRIIVGAEDGEDIFYNEQEVETITNEDWVF